MKNDGSIRRDVHMRSMEANIAVLKKTSIILISLLLISTPFLNGSNSLERSSDDIAISVKADDKLLGPGDETDIRIWLYEGEGVSATGVPDTWVNLSFDTDPSSVHSIQTDRDGYCTYTYKAPDEINHTFDVTLIAWMGNGPKFNPNGTLTLHITFRYQVEILGPKMILNGSDPVDFSIHVTVDGNPAQFSTMGASSVYIGTIVDHSIVDPINGIGKITYGPPNGIGRARIWISIQGSGYGAERYEIGEATFDFMIVEEIAPLNITVETDNMNCRRWGSLNLTVTATRGGYPAAGVRIDWSVTRGWLSEQITYTDQNGMSMVHYTATHTDDSLWNDVVNVTVTADDGVERKVSDCWFNVWTHTPEWDIDVSYQAFGLQLLPGEDLSIDLCLNGWYRLLWHFIAGIRVDVVIYDIEENEYARKTIFENINIDSLKYYFESDKEQILRISEDMPPGEYYWEVLVLSPDGVHTYWRKQPRYEKLLILNEEEEAWTFMVFVNGDNNLGGLTRGLIDDLEGQAPDGEFRIICQLDTPWNTMERYEITPDREYNRI
ncbi:MAG: Ig-like domain-containing protein, partial [Candidatus Thermoplasmatota archaeon]|nr:Ig-like domain-containing protein [Candidatus Thermoplasmatota archaeon]